MFTCSTISAESTLELLLHISSCETHINPRHFELVLADYIRKNLHSLSTTGEESKPVYITRIVNTVVSQIKTLLSSMEIYGITYKSLEELEVDIKRIMKVLRDLRDVVDLGNGYWAPTPIRFVDIPKSADVLVVGGLPTYNLNTLYSPIFKVSGFVRYADKLSLINANTNNPILWQDFNDWIGFIPPDLKRWSKQIMISAAQHLQQSASSYENFELYCPWEKSRLQHYRWVEYLNFKSSTIANPKELILCRSKNRPRTFWLGKFSEKALVMEARVPNSVIRRLMYGLDIIHENTVEVTWSDNIITLKNWLPPEERRLLSSLGIDCSPESGRYPIMYKINPEWTGLVEDRLISLGLSVRRINNECQ